MSYTTIDGRLQWRSEERPLCFFCARPLEAHDDNAQGHPWRVGPRVLESDLAQADELTRALHQRTGG